MGTLFKQILLIVGVLLLPLHLGAQAGEQEIDRDALPSLSSSLSTGDEAPGPVETTDEAGNSDVPPSSVEEIPVSEVESSNPEMVHFESADTPVPPDSPQVDPLDEEETQATLAVIGAEPTTVTIEEEIEDDGPSLDVVTVAELMEQLKPYKKGDKELSIGIGGSGYGGSFTLTASAVFAYYVVNRFAPGLELDYQATWGSYEYPQSFTLFPFVKFVLVRSRKVAPYVLAGAGRTMQWGGVDDGFDESTGDLSGFKAVGSWVVGAGGGVMIGIGARARLQIQMLAMYRVHDEEIWREVSGTEVSYYTDATGSMRATHSLLGERTDRYWYPAPSFWFSFAL